MKNLKNLAILVLGIIIMFTICYLSYDLGVKDAEHKQYLIDNNIKTIYNKDSIDTIITINENTVYTPLN